MKFKNLLFVFFTVYTFSSFSSDQQNQKALQSYITEDLFSTIVLPYAFEPDGSSPEALCESLNKYFSYLKNNYSKFSIVFNNINSQKLIKKSIKDINVIDKNGNTALHFACQRGYVDVVKALIANDIDINALADDVEGSKTLNEYQKKLFGQFHNFSNGKKIEELIKRHIIHIVKYSKDHIKRDDEPNGLIRCQWHALADAIIMQNIEIVNILRKIELKNFQWSHLVYTNDSFTIHYDLFNAHVGYETAAFLSHDLILPDSIVSLVSEYCSGLDIDYKDNL